jgi:peptidoglycan/xylan/chitin deacetylase (PgdA/CDA1 family)
MQIHLSFDDGHRLDLYLAEVLEAHGFRATFFLPDRCDLHHGEVRELAHRGHQIGGHTVTHPVLRDLPFDLQYWEVQTNRDTLENILGTAVTDFAYPKGKYDTTTIEAVRRAGYLTARTTDVGFTGREVADRLRLPTSVHIHPARREYAGEAWLAFARRTLAEARASDGVYHLWGHSWEIDKYDLWDELETLLQELQGVPC